MGAFAVAREAEIGETLTRAAAAFLEWRARSVSERVAAVQRASAAPSSTGPAPSQRPPC